MATKTTRKASISTIGRQYIARNSGTIMYARSQWWYWDGKVWQPRHDIEQQNEFWKLIEEFEQKDGQAPSLNKVQNVKDFVRSRLFVGEQHLDTRNNLINLQNGVYNLDDGNLYPHDPTYYMTTILPFEYEPKARAELWQMYLMTTFVQPRSTTYDPELAGFVQEAFGYSLTTDTRQHVTFWCVGEGANGKGVLFHVLEQLGGTAATTLNVGLLSREQYQLANLAGKRIALCSEASATQNLVEDALIKALVAGDTMSVRQIRKEPFELQPTAKLWWAMNELPPVADTSEGFWRRMRVIPFNRLFTKDERIFDLKERMDLELSGIFNWAMAGLHRLRDRGSFPEPYQVHIATARYREEANPVKLFVTEKCIVDQDFKVSASVIYGEYKNWCLDNTFRPHSSKNFKKEMERLGFYSVRTGAGMHFDGINLKIWMP